MMGEDMALRCAQGWHVAFHALMNRKLLWVGSPWG